MRSAIKKNMGMVFLLGMLFFLESIYANQEIPGNIKKKSLLNGIKLDKWVFRPMLINDIMMDLVDKHQSSPNDALVQKFEVNQKMKYPKWDWSNLYFYRAIIEGYEYRVIFDPSEQRCILAVDKFNDIQKFRDCSSKMKKCIFKTLEKDDYQVDQIKKCKPKSDCEFKSFDTGREINLHYCEIVYKRKL